MAIEKTNPYIYPSGQPAVCWICLCDCGKRSVVRSQHLLRGDTRSCGCFRREVSASIHTTHGMTKTRLYKIWDMMRQRCMNPNDNAYEYYGGRGITICDEWGDFTEFYGWAIANGYSDELSVDRIDNNGGYSPENCRWATAMEQGNNKRNNLLLTCFGRTQTVAQWARETGINKDTIYRRIKKYGWTDEKAVTTQPRKWTHKNWEE